jgi:TRAP-type mannitol/chloroaromatic compound transport system substrate-binding protein
MRFTSKLLRGRAAACALWALVMLVGCGRAPDAGLVRSAEEHQPVSWRMASTFSSSLVLLGPMGKRVESLLDEISGGNIRIKFYEPGALAPPFELFDAISYGAIEAGWSTSGYWSGREPALELFTAVPFGPSAAEYLAWFDYGGGRELFEEVYHRHNIHSLICGISPPEAAGWFKRPIERVEDFRNMRIRFFGLGGRVLEKLGASVQLLAAGDLLPALELGTIDGLEFSMPAVDLRMGFHQVAKNYYFPGWHQQTTFFELMINRDAWLSLSDMQRAQIETVCSANIRHGLSEGEALQVKAIAELEQRGVQLRTFPPEVMAALRSAWEQVAAEMSAENADFARGYESLTRYREAHRAWYELGYLRD